MEKYNILRRINNKFKFKLLKRVTLQLMNMEEEQLAYNSDSGEENVDIDAISDDAGAQIGWIKWFCSLEGHEFLAEIDEDFIKD